jgi:hypothetical protein
MEALILVVELGGPTMFARIGVRAMPMGLLGNPVNDDDVRPRLGRGPICAPSTH